MAQPEKLTTNGTHGVVPGSCRFDVAGNSERIAAQHYLQVLESHFQKATQHTAASGDFETHRVTENAKTLGNSRVLTLKMGDEGLEPTTSTV